MSVYVCFSIMFKQVLKKIQSFFSSKYSLKTNILYGWSKIDNTIMLFWPGLISDGWCIQYKDIFSY